MKLTNENFLKAKDYLYNHARKVDLEWFRVIFEDSDGSFLLEELKKFQNEDGGFQSIIEPDMRNTFSSVQGTVQALKYFEKIRCEDKYEMIKKAIKYLEREYNKEQNYWLPVSKSINDYPHAPWWHFNAETGLCNATFGKEWGLPGPEALGFMIIYKDFADMALIEKIKEKNLTEFNSLSETPDMNELSSYAGYYYLIEEKYNIEEKFIYLAEKIIDRESEKWDNYGAQPLMFIKNKKTPLYSRLKDIVDINLDYLIEKQDASGCWKPEWKWGWDEDNWKIASEEWSGFLTVDYLSKLKKFDRI